MSAQTAEITKILGVRRVATTPPNAIRAFKQTRFHSIWDRKRRVLTRSVDLAAARNVKREWTVDEAQRQ
jgi:hypothetical protein